MFLKISVTTKCVVCLGCMNKHHYLEQNTVGGLPEKTAIYPGSLIFVALTLSSLKLSQSKTNPGGAGCLFNDVYKQLSPIQKS